MAERTATNWVCDRCGGTVTTEPGVEPAGWLGVTLADTPRSEAGERVHFCEACGPSFSEWFNPTPEPEAVDPEQGADDLQPEGGDVEPDGPEVEQP